mmetsp:Transcript_21228/g.53241  ORF Transcript_21228/g.53241 Transcript_21228/m.53241 type:complete len:235 (-) Transcript_21228:755-1459(-)
MLALSGGGWVRAPVLNLGVLGIEKSYVWSLMGSSAMEEMRDEWTMSRAGMTSASVASCCSCAWSASRIVACPCLSLDLWSMCLPLTAAASACSLEISLATSLSCDSTLLLRVLSASISWSICFFICVKDALCVLNRPCRSSYTLACSSSRATSFSFSSLSRFRLSRASACALSASFALSWDRTSIFSNRLRSSIRDLSSSSRGATRGSSGMASCWCLRASISSRRRPISSSYWV